MATNREAVRWIVFRDLLPIRLHRQERSDGSDIFGPQEGTRQFCSRIGVAEDRDRLVPTGSIHALVHLTPKDLRARAGFSLPGVEHNFNGFFEWDGSDRNEFERKAGVDEFVVLESEQECMRRVQALGRVGEGDLEGRFGGFSDGLTMLL